jgi:type II secretory pathway pseudopilin PulG
MRNPEPTPDNITVAVIVIVAILLLMAAFAHAQESDQQKKFRLTASEQSARNVAQDAVDELYTKYQDAVKAKSRLDENIVNDHIPGQDYTCEIDDQYVVCEKDQVEQR